MVGSRIPSALIVSGTLLVVLYATAWTALLWSARGQAAATPDAGPDTGELSYSVTDAQGHEHLMLASSSDQSALLLEVHRRFGDGASVRRLDAREAAQLRQQRPGLPSSRLWLGVALLLPLSLIWAGVRLRRRELAIEKAWNALRPTLSVSLTTLVQRTGQAERELKGNLARISKRGWADLQFHPESGSVFDGRLSSYSLTLSYCPQCNEPVNARMLADLNQVPSCPACRNPYDRRFLEGQKQELVGTLVEESTRRAREHRPDGDFSIARYAVFAVLFPPLALSYALAKAE